MCGGGRGGELCGCGRRCVLSSGGVVVADGSKMFKARTVLGRCLCNAGTDLGAEKLGRVVVSLVHPGVAWRMGDDEAEEFQRSSSVFDDFIL